MKSDLIITEKDQPEDVFPVWWNDISIEAASGESGNGIKTIRTSVEFEFTAGLGNYLQTGDREKAKRVARKLRSGCVYINGNAADAGTPFGGYRQSGNGREGGVWGLDEYLEVKTVTGWK